MTSDAPFRWTDPQSWPFFVWIWVAFVLGGWAWSLWKWQRKRIEAEWPSTTGRIESAAVDDSQKKLFGLEVGTSRNEFPAIIQYSYSVGGQSFAGSAKRPFGSIEDARDYVRDLAGRSIEVQYNPSNPAKSALTDAAIETVQQTRPPAPASVTEAVIPAWARPFVWILVAISLAGLALSAWVHVQSLRGEHIPGGFMALHAGIFVVWFPAVLVAVRLGKGGRGKDLWKRVLRGAPQGVRYGFYALFAYDWIAMMYTFFQDSNAPAHKSATDPTTFRGFSAAWMIFYAAAAAILYSATQVDAMLDRCVNGHAVVGEAMYCPTCGQPVIRSVARTSLE